MRCDLFANEAPEIWNWSQIILWLFTSLMGALIIKFIDWIIDNSKKKNVENGKKIDSIIEHIDKFAELLGLYKTKMRFSWNIVQDEKGNLVKDSSGNFLVNEEIFVPDPATAESIKKIYGDDLDTLITNKKVQISLSSTSIAAKARELDKSGQLRKDLEELYILAVWRLDRLINQKDNSSRGDLVKQTFEQLTEASSFLEKLHANVDSRR